jgi:hypothetical protein
LLRGRLRLREVLLESVELPLPELAVVGDPFGGALHGFGSEPAAVHAPVFVALDKSRFREHAQMLRHRGKRHVVRRGEIADGSLAKSKLREDAAAGSVGKSAEGGVEARVRMLNHMVYY